MTLDQERTLVTIIIVVALCLLAWLSGFSDAIVTILSTGVGAILGYWFGSRNGDSMPRDS